MASRFSGIVETLTRHRRAAFIGRFEDFVKRMPPGDKAIALTLAGVLAVVSFASLIALERTVLVSVPVHGGTLVEGEIGSPRFANPLLALTDADRDIVALTYAGLMGKSADGLTPVLAESYTISPDGKIYTFTLRKGLVFSDGTPITADDVIYTVTKAQDPALKSPEFANWANVRAEAVDARTVRFTLPKAYAPFLENTTLGILPTKVWRTIESEQFPFAPAMQRPIGAGPFKVSRVIRDDTGAITEYDLTANTRYALGRPFLNGITLKFYGSTDELATAYKNRVVESAYGISAPGALTAPYARVFGVFFNQSDNKALAQLAVRKALSIAIDRDHIVNELLGGYATPLMGPVPPGGGVNEPAIPQGDRVALAKQVLTDAGWTFDDSEGVWTNKKLKLSLDSVTVTTGNVPELKTLATAVQSDWQKLGVPTSLVFENPNTLVADTIRPRKFEALFFGMVIGRGQDLFAFWDSSQKSDPGLNIAQYGDKSVDALVEKLRTENNPSVRATTLQSASDAIAADYPAAFTHAPDFVYVMPPAMKGVVLGQIATPADRFASVASWHRYSQYVWPFLASSE